MYVIIYHDDNDGRCAAAITLKHIKQTVETAGVIFIPATYGDTQMIVDGVSQDSIVYVVDFSFSEEQFNQLAAKTQMLVWIDHHKSAIDKLKDTGLSKLPGIRSIEKAACVHTWDYLFPNDDMPMAVKFIGDRDAWQWVYGEQTAEFHYGLGLHDTDPRAGIWNLLLHESSGTAVGKLKSDGRLGLKFMEQRFSDLRGAVMFDTEIDGHSVRAMNIAIAGSAAFGAHGWATGALPSDVEICCQYYHNGKVFTVSLYSKKGTVDVSELAKKRGGGGHAHASGFTSVDLPDFLRKQKQ